MSMKTEEKHAPLKGEITFDRLPAPKASTPAPAKSFIIRPGEISERVKEMQHLLNNWLKNTHPKEKGISADGEFGSATVNLLKRFQTEELGGPDRHGFYGPNTDNALRVAAQKSLAPLNPMLVMPGLKSYFAIRDGKLKIRVGDIGEHIGIFQSLLNRYRTEYGLKPIKITEKFDTETLKATKDFQKQKMGVANPSGVVGKNTIRKLETIVK